VVPRPLSFVLILFPELFAGKAEDQLFTGFNRPRGNERRGFRL
jgi:hypothetical protein